MAVKKRSGLAFVLHGMGSLERVDGDWDMTSSSAEGVLRFQLVGCEGSSFVSMYMQRGRPRAVRLQRRSESLPLVNSTVVPMRNGSIGAAQSICMLSAEMQMQSLISVNASNAGTLHLGTRAPPISMSSHHQACGLLAAQPNGLKPPPPGKPR